VLQCFYVNYKLYFLLQLPTNHPYICVVVCSGNDIGKGQSPVRLAEALVNGWTCKRLWSPCLLAARSSSEAMPITRRGPLWPSGSETLVLQPSPSYSSWWKGTRRFACT